MMFRVRARFDGHVFVPEEPVDLPVGCVLEIPITPASAQESPSSTLSDLAELVAGFPANPDWPADGAAQVDHYLYGAPKKP
jgi:hypothetical protein